jgi:probable rRNA maturation factor
VAGLARWLERAAPPRASGDVTVYLTTDARIRALNRRYRGHDRVTDVLSFGAVWRSPQAGSRKPEAGSWKLEAESGPFLGDIVIALGRARRQANEARHSLATELRILSLHGLLHLAGFDHETDDGRMARVERTLRRRAGLGEGLIERAGVRRARVAEGTSRRGGAGGAQ